jgi:hypothetical protein
MSAVPLIELIEIWYTPGGTIRRPRITKFVADGHDLTPMVAPLSEVSIECVESGIVDIAKVRVSMIGRVIAHRVEAP